jgi:hypothetical protein
MQLEYKSSEIKDAETGVSYSVRYLLIILATATISK